MDRPRYSPPHSGTAYQKNPLTFGSPKLAVKNTSYNLLCSQQWGASSYPPSRPYSNKTSPLTIPPKTSSPPLPRMSGPVPSSSFLSSHLMLFPISKSLSNNIIQSYRNSLLFGVSACASVRGLSLPIPLMKTSFTMDPPRESKVSESEPKTKTRVPEGSQNYDLEGSCAISNQSLTFDSKLNTDMAETLQRDSTIEECTSKTMNSINGHQEPRCNQEAIIITSANGQLNHFLEKESTSTDCVQSDIEDSEDELSHSEYGSDDEDDFIQFSDESQSNDPVMQDCLPCPSIKYMSICSSESGYFECVSTSVYQNIDDDNADNEFWPDDDGCESNNNVELWNAFESQALSPMMTCNREYSCSRVTSDYSHQESSKDTATRHCQVNIQQTYESTNGLPNKAAVNEFSVDTQTVSDCITHTKPTKQVRFKPDSELVEVHVIVAWEYAYRAARRGPWEEYARDRARFRRRIDCVATVLEPCLCANLTRLRSVSDACS